MLRFLGDREVYVIRWIMGVMLSASIGLQASAQQWMVPVDSANNSILTNAHVQFEASEAIEDMYDFNFDRAFRGFIALKKQYAWHPLPYFLQGLNYWWQIVPNIYNEEFDEAFLAEMDTSLALAERLYEEVNEVEGAFFLAATHAFRGRLFSERGQYTKSALAGRSTLKYLSIVRENEDYSPEILFADALFNYYAVWIRENYPLLRPIMAFFPKGDKVLGVQQLNKVATNAFYSRTEAQYFLMRILALEENDLIGGLRVSSYLYETYPNNAYFHRFFTRLLYQTGKYRMAEKECHLILQRVDSMAPGYESNSARYAAFFLGHIYELRKNYEDAKEYFLLSIEHSEKAGAIQMGYYFYSMLRYAKISEDEEKYELAQEYYQKVKKAASRKHPAYKQAKEGLKRVKKAT